MTAAPNIAGYVVLADGRDPPTLAEALSPGSLTIIYEIRPGELDVFERDLCVRLYLAAGIVVIAACQVEVDAIELMRRISGARVLH
jgi:hypothetical protein